MVIRLLALDTCLMPSVSLSFIWIPLLLSSLSGLLSLPVDVDVSAQRSHPFCQPCLRFAEVVQDMIQNNKTYADIRSTLISVCAALMDANGYHGHVICPGFVDEYGPPTLYIISKGMFSPPKLCERLELCPGSSEERQYGHVTRSMEPVANVEYVHGRDTVDQQEPIRILQLTDIHLDHQYKPGTPVDCGMLICCRDGLNGSGSAGTYGEYSCEVPVATLDLLTEHLRQLDPQPNFTIYTGDNPPHDIWEENWQSQTQSTNFIVDYLSKNLPNQIIYPAMGNHETFPQSFYYPPMYKNFTAALAEFWQSWVKLPENALQTIRAGGYYTMLVRPGLRLMSINTEFGYQFNFYTLLNDQTPGYFEQRKWMEETLAAAAGNGEKVLIIGHVPPGDPTTIMSYGDFYGPLVSQYRDVIVGQLFGHVHQDLFQVVHTGGYPAGVVNIAPSVTTRANVNPTYRIYLMDPNTYHLIDYQQYYINLTEANILAKQNHAEAVEWKLAYTAREEYNLKDFTAKSWWELTERFERNSSLLLQYLDNMYARSDVDRQCGELCKRELVCGTKSASKRQLLQCLE